jgi:multidrug efflux pump subunit AcrB
LLLRDIADISSGTMPGQFDRYNMKREVSLTASLAGTDLGAAATRMNAALARVQREAEQERAAKAKQGEKPGLVTHEVRGQIPPMRQMISGLGIGLLLAVVVIFLLLAANFQSWRLAFITVSAAPGVLVGVLVTLLLSGTTLNIQSFIGAIMAIGVAMANAILLVSFAEHHRRAGQPAHEAAISAAGSRLRPILMTSLAMTAGMLPLALALGEAGPQTAPLGRAVIGGLVAATICTLFILPALFALVQAAAPLRSASLDPSDPESPLFAPAPSEMN